MIQRILWRRTCALFLAFLVGCSSIPRGPYVEEAGQGKAVVHIPRTADLQLVVLDKEEFRKAIRQLAREARLSGTPRQTVEKRFQMDPQFGNYLYLPRDKKLVPTGQGEPLEGTLTKEDLETAEGYRLWCQRVHHFYGDCLGGAWQWRHGPLRGYAPHRHHLQHERHQARWPLILDALADATATCRSVVAVRR